MDDALRTQIICAAIQSVGPMGQESPELWQAKVADRAAAIAAWCQPGSFISKTIEQVMQSKTFVGSVVKIEQEITSTRGIVTLRTAPNEHHPDGIETVRTERTDNPLGRMMVRKVKSLIGHKALLYVEVEPISNSTRKSRVLRHIEDLGVDPSQQQAVRTAAH